jgi:methionyl-tRNA formyltransferase
MKVVFFGCTRFSESIFKELLMLKDVNILAIFSIPKEFSISYRKDKVLNANFADLSGYAQSLGIPLYLVDSEPGKRISDYKNIITQLNPDVILVMGWYYMVPKNIRELAKYGAWGIHASLLPKYAGGAPLVWAIIEGESSTGVTLFKLSDGVDDGDIISQVEFPIAQNDTIREVYENATIASIQVINDVFCRDFTQISFKVQDKSKIKVYPQRSPTDGEIDWSLPIEKIRNFIRAQTRPYPGAWTLINGKKVTIWDATIEENQIDD